MKRLVLFSIFLAVQLAVALTAGYAALDSLQDDRVVRPGAVYSGIDYSGMDIETAVATMVESVNGNVNNGFASFSYKDTEFVFRLSDIGLSADFSRIGPRLTARGSPFYTNALFTAFTRRYEASPGPDFFADSDAFLQKLTAMKAYIDKPPVNADVEFSTDGEIVKFMSFQGVNFDAVRGCTDILPVFLSDPFKQFSIDANPRASASLLSIEPQAPYELVADIDSVVSDICEPIPEGCDAALIARVAEAVNKVWVPKNRMAYGAFSFLRYIEESGLPIAVLPREYDFVASELMRALLACGEDSKKMEFTIADSDVDSILRDFKFVNTLDSNIVIFAGVESGSDELRIRIAGKGAP